MSLKMGLLPCCAVGAYVSGLLLRNEMIKHDIYVFATSSIAAEIQVGDQVGDFFQR